MQLKRSLLTGVAFVAIPAAAVLASPAAADPLPAAATYADLLEPVPAASQLLAADDANRVATAQLQPAQYWVGNAHHHHHHHHHSARWYQRHGYFWNGGQWLIRPRYHHHHHHHHHHQWGY